jgi:uncharacterized protein (TIRG00374 family)
MELAWLVPAIICFLISMLFRTQSWKILLQHKVPYGRVYLTLNEGYLLNNVLPFRLGELGRAFLLSQASDLSGFFVLSTIVIERTYDMVIASTLLLATIPLVFGVESGQAIALVVLVVVTLALVVMFLLARYREAVNSKLEKFGLLRPVFREKILPRIKSILSGFEVLSRIDQFLYSLFFMILSWFFGAFVLYFLAISFGIEVQPWWIGFVLGVISLGIALPSAPAGLGVYEVAMVGAFSLLGVPSSQALAVALVAHLINITITGFIGMYGLFRDGETLSNIYQQLKNVRYIGGG